MIRFLTLLIALLLGLAPATAQEPPSKKDKTLTEKPVEFTPDPVDAAKKEDPKEVPAFRRTVWVWGLNTSGQMGNGAINGHETFFVPTRVEGLPDIQAIRCGDEMILALDADGNLWSWGSNGFGELGRPATEKGRVDTLCSSKPEKIPTLSGVSAIASSSLHHLALADGSVYAWGYNEKGELGFESTTKAFDRYAYEPFPRKIPDLSGVTEIAAGICFNVALKTDGTVWTWGSNQHGQTGLGREAGDLVRQPRQVTGIPDKVTSIAGGWCHALVRTDRQEVYQWGPFDELNKKDPAWFLPSKVEGLTRITGIRAGGSLVQAYAVTDQGPAIYAWGGMQRFEPKPVRTTTFLSANVLGVWADDMRAEIRPDGSVWRTKFETGDPDNRPLVDTGLRNAADISVCAVNGAALIQENAKP